VLNIAHRGASGTFPENTLSAFRAAIDAGADMCELDVQLTRDGAVVVIHDETVNRTTDGTGEVAALTLEEIQRLDAGAKFKGGKIKGETLTDWSVWSVVEQSAIAPAEFPSHQSQGAPRMPTRDELIDT